MPSNHNLPRRFVLRCYVWNQPLLMNQTRAINLIALIRAMAYSAVTLISKQALTKLQKIASLLSTQPKQLAPP